VQTTTFLYSHRSIQRFLESVLASTSVIINCTYRPFLVLDGRNFTLALAVVLFGVVSELPDPSLGVFVERSPDRWDGPVGHGFGGSGMGGTAAVFTFDAALANKSLRSDDQ